MQNREIVIFLEMKIKIFIFLLIASFINFSCVAKNSQNKTVKNTNNYISVSMAEGLKMMETEKDFILLDVRRYDEYSSGHIPNAILLTNETITKEKASALLKDKNQKIFVYCRSGRRSKEASQKLADFGYTKVIEIGGILDYKGNLEK